MALAPTAVSALRSIQKQQFLPPVALQASGGVLLNSSKEALT
jgi:hypothetical protein